MNKRIVLFVLVAMMLIIATPVRADGIIIIDPPPQPPPDWVPWLTIRYHRVTVDIINQVVTTKIDQVFCNDGHSAAEGTYIFPLPPEAVVQHFTMWVDGKPIEGKVLPADQVRDIYESYVQRQRDPALLEYLGRDAVRARIFPIPPGEERRIQLEYTQILPTDGAMLYYRYPLDTERFSNLPLEHVSIQVNLESKAGLRAIYSPSHQNEIVITRHSANYATISYEANNILPDRDFELYAGTADEEVAINLLTYQNGTEGGFFLLMLTPALRNEVQYILPRDIFLVLDTSGSMDGEKLQQAQESLAYILQHLNPKDRFNVIAFSSEVRTYAPSLRPAADAENAVDWVYGLEALGGTNIYLALSEALMQTDPDRSTVIIFLTDGLPTEGIIEEETLLSTLAKEAPDSARIFPFGVGYDVNTLLLDQLAKDHKGNSAYVEPHEHIDEKVSAFYARIQSPVLTNIALDFDGLQTYDLYPSPLPDLFAGTQLIVTGRYTGSGRRRIALMGKVDGRDKTYVYEGDFSGSHDKNFIPRLWAARKIGHLLTQIRLHGENDEWIDAIVKLSLRYGIITPYTAFLVEEPTDVLTSEGRDRAANEFEKSVEMAALPSSGEGAVEDAKLRQDLGAAEAPPTAGGVIPGAGTGGPSNSVRYAGDKTFLCEHSICTDTTYIPDKMTPQEIIFMSDAYWRIIGEHPEFTDYFSVGTECYFVAVDGNAYHFRLGTNAEIVPRPETSSSENQSPPPTPTTPPASTTTPTPFTPANASNNTGLCGGTIALVAVSAVIGLQTRRWRHKSHIERAHT